MDSTSRHAEKTSRDLNKFLAEYPVVVPLTMSDRKHVDQQPIPEPQSSDRNGRILKAVTNKSIIKRALKNLF